MIALLRARSYRMVRTINFKTFFAFMFVWCAFDLGNLYSIAQRGEPMETGYLCWSTFEFFISIMPIWATAWYAGLSQDHFLMGIPFQKKNSQVFLSGVLFAMLLTLLTMTCLWGVFLLARGLFSSILVGETYSLPKIIVASYLYSISMTAMCIFLMEIMHSQLFATIWGLVYSTGLGAIILSQMELILIRLAGQTESDMPLMELTRYMNYYRFSLKPRSYHMSMDHVHFTKAVIVFIVFTAGYLGLAWLIHDRQDVQ